LHKGVQKLRNLTGGRRLAIHRSDEVLVPLVGHIGRPITYRPTGFVGGLVQEPPWNGEARWTATALPLAGESSSVRATARRPEASVETHGKQRCVAGPYSPPAVRRKEQRRYRRRVSRSTCAQRGRLAARRRSIIRQFQGCGCVQRAAARRTTRLATSAAGGASPQSAGYVVGAAAPTEPHPPPDPVPRPAEKQPAACQ
jgi:hypothetical protein